MVWEPEHPGAVKGWVYEHRFVAEQGLGRLLERGEEVHHINGVKDDNRPENLQVLGKREHCAETGKNNWGRLTSVTQELEEYRRRFGPLKEK